MKKIALLFLASSLLVSASQAQEDPDKIEASQQQIWSFSLSTLQWNESLRLQDGISLSHQPANYNALTFTLMKEVTYSRWGWSAGAFIGSGRANGGTPGGEYLQNKVAFTTLGVTPRAFYRLSGRINTGVTLMGLYKNIEWPHETRTQIVDSGRNLYVSALLDLNIRVFRQWDFYSGLGPLTQGTTLWRIGANYRF